MATARAGRRPSTASYSRVCIPSAGRIERTFRCRERLARGDVLDHEQRAPEAAALGLLVRRADARTCPIARSTVRIASTIVANSVEVQRERCVRGGVGVRHA